VIVDKGETLINCLSYINRSPLRAGLVERPEDYRWNSLRYHVQTNNRDNFLSTDFGQEEFNVKSKKKSASKDIAVTFIKLEQLAVQTGCKPRSLMVSLSLKSAKMILNSAGPVG